MRYVYLHPVFDERKCAHRFWYALRAAFEAKGMKLESFDYRGTGEAQGEFAEVSLESLREDTAGFIAGDTVCLVGVRFGANLALDYCSRNQGQTATLVLLEPIVKGSEYLEYLRRKQRIKDMMTGLDAAELAQEGFENIEGYKTSVRFIGELKSLDMARLVRGNMVGERVYLVGAGKGPSVDGELKRLGDAIGEAGNAVVVENMSMPIFWERIGRADYGQVTEKVLRWCHG